jgi:hypothetical protein
MDDNNLSEYYVIKFELFLDMIKQIDTLYSVLSQLIKEHVSKNELQDWPETPIPELAGYFAAVNELKGFLDDIVNNPTEEEVELMIKNDIKDIVISFSDLNVLNIMFGALEEFSDRLFQKHGIVTNIQ